MRVILSGWLSLGAEVVSALRDERGLRTVQRNAEPQVVGLAPQTTVNDRRANTMKTYILCDPKAVEPQNRQLEQLLQKFGSKLRSVDLSTLPTVTEQ